MECVACHSNPATPSATCADMQLNIGKESKQAYVRASKLACASLEEKASKLACATPTYATAAQKIAMK